MTCLWSTGATTVTEEEGRT